MSYEYTYLLMGVFFGIFWIFFYFFRKDNRKEMLTSSVLFAFAGPASDILYTQDWWKPLTITGNSIGFESILVGFMIGGIAAVAYEDLLGKHLRKHKETKLYKIESEINLFKTLLLSVIIFFGSFYLFELNSLYATILSTFIPTMIIWFMRRDLIINSIGSGLILMLIASVVYALLEVVTPGWVDAFWVFENTSAIIFLSLPIDDILWYLFAGMFIGPLYEFWKEDKLY